MSRWGVPGYHIEDQKPGAKKCGHQSGKVLVGQDEQNKRLNAARLQLDIMRVPGIIVARTDAEAATFIDNCTDERDQPFILGATNPEVPSYRVGFLAILKSLHDLGLEDIRGHLLFAVPEEELRQALAWLGRAGLMSLIELGVGSARDNAVGTAIESLLDTIDTRYSDIWQEEAGLKTYGEAVAEILELRGRRRRAVRHEAPQVARLREERSRSRRSVQMAESLGIRVAWDPELPKTPEGYYQVQGGIDYAIAKSLAAAPFADLLWMETKTANLEDARRFAQAIHAEYPDKMLAYNLSPSFNWDTTGRRTMRCGASPRSSGSSASCSTSSHMRAIRSMASPRRSSPRRCVTMGCSPSPASAEVPAAGISLQDAAITRRR